VGNELVTKEWYGRGTHKYNPEIHFPLLHKVFGDGHGIAAFCAQASISVPTFVTWCKKYPEFKEEYQKALAVGAAKWEYLPFKMLEEGRYFDFRYWASIGKSRFGRLYRGRLDEPKEDTIIGRLKAVWESVEEGSITFDEYSKITAGLLNESKITEIELQKQAADQMKQSNEESKSIPDETLKELHKAFELIKSGKGKVVLIE